MQKTRQELGRYSREKGKRFERTVASLLKQQGIDASRTAQHCGKTGQAPDVIGLAGIHIECKSQEKMRLYEWMDQAIEDSSGTGNVPVVIHKASNKPILVSMRFDDFLNLYLRAYEGKNS
jgi:Holliday junction resolvase